MYITERLKLRAWCDADLAPFAALNASPEVMRYFPATLTREQSDALGLRIMTQMVAQGFGLWAVETRQQGAFCGFVGLNRVSTALPFAPAVEISWRLAQAFHGQGYATEAAHCALCIGFNDYHLDEIVALTACVNLPSQRVMQKLGMTFSGEFDHPKLAQDHPLCRHVLYRKRRE